MDRFVSSYTMRLDAKGRVSVPAPYRTVLTKDGFDGAFCIPALDTTAIDAGGRMLVEEIDRLIESLPLYSIERDEMSTALYGSSETLKLDTEGRVILTETLKSHASIKDAVTFVGLGHKFQIWEPDRFRTHLGEAKTRMREFRKRLGHPDAPVRVTGARE
jgi:MraZ protein